MGFPGCVVDHIDRDGLNNTRGNLRLATTTENARNKKQRESRKTAGVYKGVVRENRALAKPWRAKIQVGPRRLHLGRFATAEEAARAYDAAARQLFGSFAATNFAESVVDPSRPEA
jgi:hypothetical protein